VCSQWEKSHALIEARPKIGRYWTLSYEMKAPNTEGRKDHMCQRRSEVQHIIWVGDSTWSGSTRRKQTPETPTKFLLNAAFFLNSERPGSLSVGFVGSQCVPLAGSITPLTVAPHRQPRQRRLGYRVSSRGNSTCVTCTYRISVPKVDVGESLLPAGASRLGNGDVLQRNKHLDLIPDSASRGTRNKTSRCVQLFSSPPCWLFE
jgi:hypothetical protein